MKKFTKILMMILIIFVTSACGSDNFAVMGGIRIYETDYLMQYEDTLNAIFDNDWTLISTEKKYEELEPICDHVDTSPQQFIEWTIGYQDGNGDDRTFVMNNRTSLTDQIEDYVRTYIADYYKENFYDVYIRDLTLESSSYVYCFFVRASINPDDEENKEWREKTEEYLSLLDTPDSTICFTKLTPANVFEMCPLYLSVNVSLSEHPEEKHVYEENIMKQIEDMIAAINTFTNNKLNVDVSMGYHQIIDLHTGERNYGWSIIQGEQVDDAGGLYYSRDVFYSYKGLFW